MNKTFVNKLAFPVEGRPSCARQALASTLPALAVTATSYCHPGGHANVVIACLLLPPSEKVSVGQERVSGFPKKGSGNLRESLGNFRGNLGNFRGTPGLLLSSTPPQRLAKFVSNPRLNMPTARVCKPCFSIIRTTSTTTRDRNLQFRGAVSIGGSPLDVLLFLQYLCAI